MGKNDALDRGNYRGLKMLDQVMKGIEIVLEKLLKDKITINEMYFGLLPGKSTAEANFTLRQLEDKYLGKTRSYTLHLWIWRRHLTRYQDRYGGLCTSLALKNG